MKKINITIKKVIDLDLDKISDYEILLAFEIQEAFERFMHKSHYRYCDTLELFKKICSSYLSKYKTEEE